MKITGNAGGGKAMTQWSPYRGNMYHTGGGNYMETGLVRIAEIAKKRPKERFTALVHHINIAVPGTFSTKDHIFWVSG